MQIKRFVTGVIVPATQEVVVRHGPEMEAIDRECSELSALHGAAYLCEAWLGGQGETEMGPVVIWKLGSLDRRTVPVVVKRQMRGVLNNWLHDALRRSDMVDLMM